MKKISDITGGRKLNKEGLVAKKARSERGELLEYFAFNLHKPYTVKLTAIRLSHLTLSEMYALKSQVEDMKRRGQNYQQHIKNHMSWYEKKG